LRRGIRALGADLLLFSFRVGLVGLVYPLLFALALLFALGRLLRLAALLVRSRCALALALALFAAAGSGQRIASGENQRCSQRK
jgi:hypothetical protein